jgi:hypothetical protein
MKMHDLQAVYSRLANAYHAAMSRGAFAPGSDAYFALAGDTAPMLNLTREQLQYRKVFGVRLVEDDTAQVGVVTLCWSSDGSIQQIDVMLKAGDA